MKYRLPVFILLFIFIGTITAVIYASDVQAKQTDEVARLRARADLYWKAQVKRDWGSVYDLLSPVEKAGLSKKRFVKFKEKERAIRYLSYRLADVETSERYGWTRIIYKAQPADLPDYPPRTIKIWQIWEKIEGNWYPVPPSRREDFPQLPPKMRQPKEERALLKRVDAFWRAKEEQDWQSVYEYLDPDFKSAVPAAEFLQKKAMFLYLDHHIEWVEVVDNRGRAKVLYTYRLNDPTIRKARPVEENMVESWIKVNGHWYRQVPEEAAE
ncbi:MAG: hypothetical protein JRJ12_15695 [Deltaproteobacteria bacterium]|nr:hypothetical protein [Deltaproteobacteria bacterium]MBW2072554.1 hypothetical protein [Deltaproteobacteria bacterium]